MPLTFVRELPELTRVIVVRTGPVAPGVLSLVLFQGTRTTGKPHDRIITSGTSTGIPEGTRLTPYIRYTGQDEFSKGVATIVVQADGSFKWTRQFKKSKGVTGYVAWESIIESNRVFWPKLR